MAHNSQFDINKFTFKSGESDKRDDLVFMARAAETAERYDDMCQFMRALVKQIGGKSDLTVEERNLLSVAFKNVIGARRAAWRTLNSDENKDNALVGTYKSQIEHELETVSMDVLDLLENSLSTFVKGKGDEAEVFYSKMTGDYYRYLAEFIEGKGYDQKATKHYEEAMNVAKDKLKATHPIRLGLALNFSVCCYEISKDQKRACDMAKQAFDDAISKLDQLDEASYKDSTLIMQLLRDNLTLWTSDQEQGNDDENAD